MEENKLDVVKPEFNGEIQARIKSVGEIESNMKDVKGYVQELNNYYKNVIFTEETLQQAKEEKAKVNKFKAQVIDYRKNIIAEYNKPIKTFDDTAKEIEKLQVNNENCFDNVKVTENNASTTFDIDTNEKFYMLVKQKENSFKYVYKNENGEEISVLLEYV